ncbi:hypothetical protein NMY22_g10823 [Coprinellus aureogranulatus]|nr:hypothetical protein NMY22_g10823 [Coprinellus aureogranulatus]
MFYRCAGRIAGRIAPIATTIQTLRPHPPAFATAYLRTFRSGDATPVDSKVRKKIPNAGGCLFVASAAGDTGVETCLIRVGSIAIVSRSQRFLRAVLTSDRHLYIATYNENIVHPPAIVVDIQVMYTFVPLFEFARHALIHASVDASEAPLRSANLTTDSLKHRSCPRPPSLTHPPTSIASNLGAPSDGYAMFGRLKVLGNIECGWMCRRDWRRLGAGYVDSTAKYSPLFSERFMGTHSILVGGQGSSRSYNLTSTPPFRYMIRNFALQGHRIPLRSVIYAPQIPSE